MKRTFTMFTGARCAFFTKIACVAILLLCAGSVSAQEANDEDENEIFKLGIEARFDYLNEAVAGKHYGGKSGLKVRYLNLRMDGTIGSKFSYSWRQRFNKVNSASDFVDNMDWLHLTYQPTKNWGISAGKQVVMIGGWEYDRAPIDLYFCSEYWNNVACYQLGASVTFTTNKGNDHLTLQACHSPYLKSPINIGKNSEGEPVLKADLFAYNLLWSGTHGFYSALHSVNFSEYARNKFDVYVVLGNQFTFGDAKIQLDLMNRGTSAEELLFQNFSVMGEFSYLIAKRVNIFARATYDKVGNNYPEGLFVYPGTEMTRVGGGVEYFPLGGKGNRDVRIHAAYAYNFGKNTNPAGTALDKGSYLTVGLTWRIDIISAARNIINKCVDKRSCEL